MAKGKVAKFRGGHWLHKKLRAIFRFFSGFGQENMIDCKGKIQINGTTGNKKVMGFTKIFDVSKGQGVKWQSLYAHLFTWHLRCQ